GLAGRGGLAGCGAGAFSVAAAGGGPPARPVFFPRSAPPPPRPLPATVPASAQTSPSRPIKLVVPAGPGGPTDILARLTADRMTAVLGQPVVIDNRGGAGGAIAAKSVSIADPAGYTLLFGTTATLANIPAVWKRA